MLNKTSLHRLFALGLVASLVVGMGCFKKPPKDAHETKGSEAFVIEDELPPAPAVAPEAAPAELSVYVERLESSAKSLNDSLQGIQQALVGIQEQQAAVVTQLAAVNERLAGVSAVAAVPEVPIAPEVPVAPVPDMPEPVVEVVEVPEAPAEEEAPPPAPEPEPVAAGPKVFTVEPNDDSFVEFVGYGIAHNYSGGFADFSGSISLASDAPESARGSITFDLASTYTENADLTGVLISDKMFDVANNPTAKFTIARVRAVENGYEADGNFEFLGVTRGISFPVEISLEDDGLHVSTVGSGFTIDQTEWGLVFQGFASNAILNKTLVSFDIVAPPAE